MRSNLQIQTRNRISYSNKEFSVLKPTNGADLESITNVAKRHNLRRYFSKSAVYLSWNHYLERSVKDAIS